MGSGSYSGVTRSALFMAAKSTGTSPLVHATAIREGKAEQSVHPLLDPKHTNKAGSIIRESRDGEDHPFSRAIAIMLDVTGSMSSTPDVFIEKLPSLMGMLTDNGIVQHPHILIGCIGDAYTDTVPLQISNFEADNRIDDAIAHCYPEGKGGAQNTESYELGAYFLARQTVIDCMEKRSQKGYAFFTGDELAYPYVNARQVERLTGQKIQGDIPTQEIFSELREKYEVFWILPGGTSNFHSESIRNGIRKLVGQNLIILDDPSLICETIAMTIAINEGATPEEAEAALSKAGASAAGVKKASKAVNELKRINRKPILEPV